MDENAPRPPYVQFEIRAVEDRTASIDEGHYVAKDVVFALVTPAGTRDRLEKPAEEWLQSVEEGVRQERIPEAWLFAFRQKLENYKNNIEEPEDGVPLTNWSAVSPAQVRLFQEMGIRTVEGVAEMTEEACSRIGMGARALKAKARAWLDSSTSTGKVAAEVESLRVQNQELVERNQSLEERLKKVEGMLEAHAEAQKQAGAKEKEKA